MNITEESLAYELLDEEIRTLENKIKWFYMELGSALEKMNKQELYEEGGYGHYYEYIRDRTNFSIKKATALRGVYKEFHSIMDPKSHKFDERFSPSRNKALGRIILGEIGWSKARVLKNKKDRYEEILPIGLMDLEEVLFYGSIVSKEKLIETLEKFEGIELALRIYCKVYFPELLDTYDNWEELCFGAARELTKRLAKQFDSSICENILEYLREDDFDPIRGIGIFISLKEIEKDLLTIGEFFPISNIDETTLFNYNQEPLTNRVFKEELRYFQLPFELSLAQVSTFSYEKFDSLGACGIDNFAYVLGVEVGTVKRWIEETSIEITVKSSAEDFWGKSFEWRHLSLFNSRINPSEANKNKNKKESAYTKFQRGEKVVVFTLNDIVKGLYLKKYLGLSVSLEEASIKVNRVMNMVRDLELVTPYFLAAKEFSRIIEKEEDIIKSHLQISGYGLFGG